PPRRSDGEPPRGRPSAGGRPCSSLRCYQTTAGPGRPSGNSYDGGMILEWQSRLSESVRASVKSAFDLPLDAVAFQYPPRVEMGDLALTAPFDLAKSLRRKPREIAERLAQELRSAPAVRKTEVAGGGYV